MDNTIYNNYAKADYDRITLQVPKGTKDERKALAADKYRKTGYSWVVFAPAPNKENPQKHLISAGS